MLRVVEVMIPSEDLGKVNPLIEGVKVLHIWNSGPGNGTVLIRILLDANDSEALSDRFVREFSSAKDFRIILLAAEATIPAIVNANEGDTDEVEPKGEQKSALNRVSREEVYQDLYEASYLSRIYMLMVLLSTIVAAVGLVRGDVAIIIGAMVIAPLLGPNIGLSLASALGDIVLAKQSLKSIAAGVAIAGTISFVIGLLVPVDPGSPEIAARTNASFSDIALALAAGTAGTLAFTSGVSAVVVGVMVAVALLPPLVVAGLMAGSGNQSLAAGALMLTLTNVTCVNLGAIATFYLQRVRPSTWWEAEKARKATRIAAVIWIVMLAVLFGLMTMSHMGAL